MITVHGHFGELLQGRLGSDLALVTLPCPVLGVTARRTDGAFAVRGPVSADMGTRMLTALDLPVQGRFALRATMPVGGGAGSSTASLVALGRLAGQLDPATLAAACIMAEGASDPLMWPSPERLLWASRKGVILDHLPPLPAFDILGGFFGPPVRTAPLDLRFADIADLIAAWPAACTDAAPLAQLVTEGARRTLALRGPQDDPTAALAARHGALGWAIAHTGSARALLFRAGTIPPDAEPALQAAGFTAICRFQTGRRSACS